MKENWTLYCFGDEQINITDFLYEGDHIPELIYQDVGHYFGETWNLNRCADAAKDCKFFSFRIKK